MLVGKVTKRLDVPHEDGEWIVIRKPSWRELAEAENVASNEAFSRLKLMGGDMISAMRQWDTSEAQSEARFDRATLLKSAVTEWSYDAPVSSENIDLLDSVTVDWLIGEIVGLAQPSTEADRKND